MNTVLCDTTAPIRLPPAVSIVQQQLARLTGQILRIYAHNRLVSLFSLSTNSSF